MLVNQPLTERSRLLSRQTKDEDEQEVHEQLAGAHTQDRLRRRPTRERCTLDPRSGERVASQNERGQFAADCTATLIDADRLAIAPALNLKDLHVRA